MDGRGPQEEGGRHARNTASPAPLQERTDHPGRGDETEQISPRRSEKVGRACSRECEDRKAGRPYQYIEGLAGEPGAPPQEGAGKENGKRLNGRGHGRSGKRNGESPPDPGQDGEKKHQRQAHDGPIQRACGGRRRGARGFVHASRSIGAHQAHEPSQPVGKRPRSDRSPADSTASNRSLSMNPADFASVTNFSLTASDLHSIWAAHQQIRRNLSTADCWTVYN